MLSFVGRSSGFSQYLKASVQIVAGQSRVLCPPIVQKAEDMVMSPPMITLTNRSLAKPGMSGNMKISSSFTGDYHYYLLGNLQNYVCKLLA